MLLYIPAVLLFSKVFLRHLSLTKQVHTYLHTYLAMHMWLVRWCVYTGGGCGTQKHWINHTGHFLLAKGLRNSITWHAGAIQLRACCGAWNSLDCSAVAPVMPSCLYTAGISGASHTPSALSSAHWPWTLPVREAHEWDTRSLVSYLYSEVTCPFRQQDLFLHHCTYIHTYILTYIHT